MKGEEALEKHFGGGRLGCKSQLQRARSWTTAAVVVHVAAGRSLPLSGQLARNTVAS